MMFLKKFASGLLRVLVFGVTVSFALLKFTLSVFLMILSVGFVASSTSKY